jgi:hypothetical protein
MSDKTTTKQTFVVELERARMANPIPNVSAPMQTATETQRTLLWALNASTRQSPSPTAPRVIIKTIEHQMKASGVPSPTTAAAQSSVGA